MALSYTAATDTVSIPASSSLDNLTTFTYIAWIYPTSALTSGGIIAKGTSGGNSRRSFEIRTTAVANGLYFICDHLTTASLCEANVLVANQWQCVAATHDGSNVPALYWGDLTTPLAVPTYSTSPQTGVGVQGSNAANSQYIGTYGSGTAGGAGKRIAEVGIFNRVLTLGELRDWQYYPRTLTGCVGRWQLGYNGTTSVPDRSGNFNAGSVTGATVSAHAPIRNMISLGTSSRRSFGGYTAPAAGSDYTSPRGNLRGVLRGTIV